MEVTVGGGNVEKIVLPRDNYDMLLHKIVNKKSIKAHKK